MRIRRVLALLTSVTTLHLSVASGDSACATHETNGDHGATSAHAMPMDAHAMPMPSATVSHASIAATSDVPPCDVPVQLHCCDAVAGCGATSLVAGGEYAVASATIFTASIREWIHDAPASFASAPEPPPPKV
jgi:hypothetical protein